MDEIVDIGVFSRPPGGEESDEKVLYLEKHHITGTDNTIELVLDEEPYEAGIDPYNKLVDRSSGDNRKRRSEEHTSELQSLMRISYAVFCLKKKKSYMHLPHVTQSEFIHYLCVLSNNHL